MDDQFPRPFSACPTEHTPQSQTEAGTILIRVPYLDRVYLPVGGGEEEVAALAFHNKQKSR